MRQSFLLILVCFFSQWLWAVDYAVMIDAGSTGSRVFIYEIEPNKPIKVKNKLKIEPGLATFDSNRFEMQVYLNKLLAFAKQELGPQVALNQVPLVLQATGGVRALSKTKQRRLMRTAQRLLYKSEFKKPKAEIISGIQEGIYQWKSINYLLGTLDNPQKQSTGLVEMGGASLQVTFKTAEELYSRTYDGLGETLAWNRFGQSKCKEIPLPYEVCRKSLDQNLVLIHKPKLQGEFYLVDYFEQLAALLKLEEVSSEVLDQLGPKLCQKTLPELKSELPNGSELYLSRVCFQAAYMSVVLEKVGFERTRKLVAAKEIEDTTLSWTLGSLLDNMPSSQKAVAMP
ncbi:MAG: hypothetical protein WCK42_03705 [Myxococcaceae bacterium]